MRKIKFIVIALFIFTRLFSQSISVKSFRLLGTDLTANTAGTLEKDQNGETAALIKVVTSQTGFSFDCGSIGIVKTVQKPSEIWVYVPHGVKKMTISHPQLGLLRDYSLNIPIKSACTYEMVLVTGTIETVVKKDFGAQYLVMNIEPHNAQVFIDEKEMVNNNGCVSKLFNYGRHTYTVSAPLYHSEAGVFEIGKEKSEINISLKPNYGIVSLSTIPEEGAVVYLDNDIEPIGSTPLNTKKLAQGEHIFKVQLNGYLSDIVKYKVIGNGNVQPLSIQLKPNFGIVKIHLPDGCSLYVDDEVKDIAEWNGRLGEGVHIIEARCPSHKSIPQKIEMIVGDTIDLSLPKPVPIVGSFNISSEPINAKIIIDGKEYGRTPLIINDLLIGNHDVEIKHEGYTSIKSNIEIIENVITNHEFKLTKGLNNYTWIFNKYNSEKGKESASLYPVYYEGKKTAKISIWLDDLKDKNISFDFGGKKIIKRSFDGSIHHFYIPEGTKMVKIMDVDKGEIFNVKFDIPIESGKDYYLSLRKLSEDEVYDEKLKEILIVNQTPYSYKTAHQDRTLLITNIKRNNKSTEIYFSINGDIGNWISISPETYIKETRSTKRYKISKATGISLAPQKTYLKKEKAEFILSFPPLPKSVSEIDLIEPDGNSDWQFYNIKL